MSSNKRRTPNKRRDSELTLTVFIAYPALSRKYGFPTHLYNFPVLIEGCSLQLLANQRKGSLGTGN